MVADLYKNLSAAQLKSNDFTAALSSADAAIQVEAGPLMGNPWDFNNADQNQVDFLIIPMDCP